MKTKTRREVTIEIDEVIMRRPKAEVFVWCQACGKQVRMLTPDEAATVAGVSARTVFQWIEASKLHFIELSRDQLLVCGSALPTQETEAGGRPG